MNFRWKFCRLKNIVVGLTISLVTLVFWCAVMSESEEDAAQVLANHMRDEVPGPDGPQPYINREGFDSEFSEVDFLEWLNKETWNQDDPQLVEAVRKTYLIPPSKQLKHKSLTESDNPSEGQVQAVEHILRKMTPGFFVEAGANDGELTSNTIWLERQLGWTGLLVEADPVVFEKLRLKQRNAWLANLCVSGYPYPKLVTFYRSSANSEMGGLIYDTFYGATEAIGIQSIPLYTILLALNRTTVDFLSLDLEGNELEVLETIPFDKVTIKVVTVDHTFIEDGKRAMWGFMESNGYQLYKTIRTKSSSDSIFVHASVLDELVK